MKRILTLYLLLALLGAVAHAEETTIAAAADLTYAMKELAAKFHEQTGNQVNLSFGASGNFYSQISNGAPFDAFFSADSEYVTKLAEGGKIDKGSIRNYAIGSLVLWVPNA